MKARLRSARARRGFTLIEMMVAVLIGSLGVVLAAKVAQVVIRQSSRGRQVTDFGSRSRVLTRQLRADLRAVGFGSTGAVAVDTAIGVWATIARATPGAAFQAIPVVAGANNIPTQGVGGVQVLDQSDAVMMLVPDSGQASRSTVIVDANDNQIPIEGTINCVNGMVYVVDHTAPTGAGRAQILFVNNTAPNVVNTQGRLQFTLANGSDVMCARISTYWVDANGGFHRSDISGPGAGMVQLGVVGRTYVDPANVATDVQSPGVLDFQLAYRMSSEIYPGGPPIGAPPGIRWVYAGDANNPDGAINGDANLWFEVRMVRFNMLVRTLRYIQQFDTVDRQLERREDMAGNFIDLKRSLVAEWVGSTELLTNQRLFDISAPAGLAAEPY